MAGTEKILSAIMLANKAGVSERPWQDFLNALNDLIGGVFSNLEMVDLSSGRYVELKSADDLGIGFEVIKCVQFGHSQTLRNRPAGFRRGLYTTLRSLQQLTVCD
ncbi:MAG: hypothetical protein HKP56_09140 [Anderseniella sp.]|nr:hypothetical protein [Anderseniella sp.]